MHDTQTGFFRTALSGLAFFFILAGYYMLRPLRDELGVRGGVEHLDWLFSATFMAVALCMAAYAWLSARISRHSIVSTMFAFVVFSLILFRFIGHEESAVYARGLFVWISVINMFLVSGFWSVMSDVYNTQAATRRFGIIAAGGTAGALAGPTIAAFVARFAAVENLLVTGAVCVGIAGILLHFAASGLRTRHAEPLTTEVWSGFTRLITDPRLRGLATMVVLNAVAVTFIYILQARLVAVEIPEVSDRVQFFAGIDLAVNGITILIQLGITAWLLRTIGVLWCVLLLPLFAISGFAVLAAWPLLIVTMTLTILLRATRFSLSGPAREILFTWLPASDRYRSRTAMDTLVYRASDVVGAWSITGLTALGLGTAGIAAVGVPLALCWAYICGFTVKHIRDGAVEANQSNRGAGYDTV